MGLGQNIKAARKKAGLTQKQLAEKIGVAPITIQQYENGSREPRIATIGKIADALDVTADYLAGRTRGPHTRIATQEDIDRFSGEVSFTENGVGILSTPKGTLLHHFKKLNSQGQAIAIERVKELAEIPRYKVEVSDTTNFTSDNKAEK